MFSAATKFWSRLFLFWDASFRHRIRIAVKRVYVGRGISAARTVRSRARGHERARRHGCNPSRGNRNGEIDGTANAARKSAFVSKCRKALATIRKNSSGREDEAAILRNGIAEEFNPQGLIEQEIVDDLTLNRLMKRRCDKAVSREFSKASIEKTLKLEENHQRSAVQYLLRVANIWTINGTNSQQAPRLRPGHVY